MLLTGELKLLPGTVLITLKSKNDTVCLQHFRMSQAHDLPLRCFPKSIITNGRNSLMDIYVER